MVIVKQRGVLVWSVLVASALSLTIGFFAKAAESPSDFALQVSPSPLVATVAPGETKDLELKIRNAGTGTETLKIESRKFAVNKQTGEVSLDDTAPSEIAAWVSFSSPSFTIKPGEWATQKVRISLPKDTGFSYSMALIISRTNNVKSTESGRLIKGSVAVFTLINVDRPGATRKLEMSDLEVSQSVYEYLPAKIKMSFKNTGNTIVQPYGNIFIQRGSGDVNPIATLPVNDKGGYLLPETPRTLDAEWNEGFPVFKTTTAADGGQRDDLQWDWSKLADFRIGPYTAKVVAIYNDGQRDVPIEKEVTFWVIPWRTILILLLVIGVLAFLRHKQIQRKTRKAVKRALDERDKNRGNGHDK